MAEPPATRFTSDDVVVLPEFVDDVEKATRRVELLGRITTELIGTLDAEEAAIRLSRLVVPTLADWCTVSLIEDADEIGSNPSSATTSWHRDASARPLVEEYFHARFEDLRDHTIMVRAMQDAKIHLIQSNATNELKSLFAPGRARVLLEQLAPEAVMVLPLVGRNGAVGMLNLCNGADRGAFNPEEIITAQHVAARSGVVFDNVRLYRRQLELAEQLQRSLLTAPPQPDHLEIVVRYNPASDVSQIGGDWYDAFVQTGGATMLVIGDVVGHDTQAAVAMSQMRSIVRTIGAADDVSPSNVLAKSDHVMRTLNVGTTATAVVGRLLQSPGQKDQGIHEFHWSNAGHPPPVVIDPNGDVRVLELPSADVLLGMEAVYPRRESSLVLTPGSTVLLYTDGLIERRDQPIEAGLARLINSLKDIAHLEIDYLCDELLMRMLPSEPEDDVALVAVRLGD